jgi:polysaccharide pyruvyl transferase CsaB
MNRIVISGWYGNRNVGDEAILASMLASLKKEIEGLDVTVLSTDPIATTRIHGVKSVDQPGFGLTYLATALLRRRSFETLTAFLKADVFILGGGGFLSDWQSWSVIPRWLAQIAAAKLLRKRTMLYAVGIGPISSRIGMRLTRAIVNSFVDSITVRDKSSKECLQRAGVRKEIEVTADPAISLLPGDSARAHEIIKEDGICCVENMIGLAVMPYFHVPEYWPGMLTRYETLLNQLTMLADFIVSELGVCVVIIPMQVPEDLDFSNRILNHVKHRDRVWVVRGEYAPVEIMGIMGQMKMIIGMRLHSLILAAAMAVPVVGVVTHSKSWEFLSELDQEQYAVGLGDGANWPDNDIDIEDLKAKIREVWLHREEIALEIEERLVHLKERESENGRMLKNLIDGVHSAGEVMRD